MQSFYLAGLRAVRHFQMAQTDYMRAMERVATGLRINGAADDPAGLAISEKMRAQIRGLKQASKNAQDTISMLNVADGALHETHSILQRLREISVYAATGTLSDADRRALQDEFNELSIRSILTPAEASAMINDLDEAIGKVSAQRSNIGAKTRRLEHTINNLDNTALNLAEAESRIRDADIVIKASLGGLIFYAGKGSFHSNENMEQRVYERL